MLIATARCLLLAVLALMPALPIRGRSRSRWIRLPAVCRKTWCRSTTQSTSYRTSPPLYLQAPSLARLLHLRSLPPVPSTRPERPASPYALVDKWLERRRGKSAEPPSPEDKNIDHEKSRDRGRHIDED